MRAQFLILQTEEPPQIEGTQVTSYQVCAQRDQRVHPSFAVLPISSLTFRDEFENREVLCLAYMQTFSGTKGRHVLRIQHSPWEPQYQLEHATVCGDFSARRERSEFPDLTVS